MITKTNTIIQKTRIAAAKDINNKGTQSKKRRNMLDQGGAKSEQARFPGARELRKDEEE